MNSRRSHLKTLFLTKHPRYQWFKARMETFSVDLLHKIGLEKMEIMSFGLKMRRAGYFHLTAVKNSLSKINNGPYSTITNALVNLEVI